jgi:hypothetical protein
MEDIVDRLESLNSQEEESPTFGALDILRESPTINLASNVDDIVLRSLERPLTGQERRAIQERLMILTERARGGAVVPADAPPAPTPAAPAGGIPSVPSTQESQEFCLTTSLIN